MKILIALLLIGCSSLSAQQYINGSRVIAGTINHCEPSGGTDDYACTLEATLGSYITGLIIQMKADVSNTGAATIDVSGLGAKTIVKVAGGITTALASNDIRAGQVVTLVYDGTNFQMQSLLGNTPAAATAVGVNIGSPNAVVAASATRYSVASISWNATELSATVPFPATGTLSNLYIRTSTSQPATGSLVCTVRLAQAATAITLTIAAGTTAGNFSDLVNTAAVTAGDLYDLQCVNGATSNSAVVQAWSVRIQ